MADTVIPFRRYGKLDGAPVRASINYNYKVELTEADRSRLANAHIDIFEQKLRMLNPHLRIDEATRNRIHSIAMDPHNSSPEAIMQSVIAATSEALPASAQDHRERFQSQYDIDGHKHHSDIARQMMRMAFDTHARGGRYGDLGAGELSHSDLQNMAAARAIAHELGMGWALNNPELLRLGPAAIKTLHDAGVQRERFERMTGKSVGFDASTAVEIAAFARRHNLTPEQTNKLYDKISDGVEVISGGNKAIQRELDVATDRYVTGADTPEARRALREAYEKHADTPEKKQAAADATQAHFEAAERDRADVAVRNSDVAVRDVAKAQAIAKSDDLDAGLGIAAATPEPKKETKAADAGKTATKTVAAQSKAIAPKV
ncbi:MAG: hypothetical protein ACLPPF_21150 [Rhodomicrobium sp.]